MTLLSNLYPGSCPAVTVILSCPTLPPGLGTTCSLYLQSLYSIDDSFLRRGLIESRMAWNLLCSLGQP